METASPTSSARNFNLDAPPPTPPASSKGGAFMPPPPTGGGLGEMANSPQLMTMQGLAMAKDAFQLIANGLPMLSQLLSNTVNDLEQLVAQATAQSMAGQAPAITAPPGVAPMMTPPPGGPMPSGPPQGGPPMGGGPGPMPGM